MKIVLGIIIGFIIALLVIYAILKHTCSDIFGDIMKFIFDLPNHF